MSMKSTFPAFPKNDTDLFQCGRTKRTAYHVYHVLKWDAPHGQPNSCSASPGALSGTSPC